jgi:glycosyltransferase involved in cell wall biosynthesis
VKNSKYSVVVPVFNGASTIQEVVRRASAFFEQQGLDYEIILVNDGSWDDSWPMLEKLSKSNRRVLAIDLVKNYGQHNANLCGFRHATGDYVITLDDDLQNPPEEIGALIAKAREGHDLVIGKFKIKQHSFYRRLGSKIINAINSKVFNKPPDLAMTNFRLIHRSVVERVNAYKGQDPYIPGLVIAYAGRPANVEVNHAPREYQQSNYTLKKILKLVFSLLFHYSTYPLRVLVVIGGLIALASFCLGVFLIVKALFFGTGVPGWTSTVTLISFFSGFIILLLGTLGEYLIHVVRNLNQPSSYFIREISKYGA